MYVIETILDRPIWYIWSLWFLLSYITISSHNIKIKIKKETKWLIKTYTIKIGYIKFHGWISVPEVCQDLIVSFWYPLCRILDKGTE